MPGDSKAFNEVRALLSKLDRSIDEARSKRVGPKDEPPARNQVASENASGGRSGLDRQIGVPGAPATPQTPMQAKRAQYGRARPLNGGDSTPSRPPSESAWKSPKNYDDLTIG
jgi:hypothetical protein